MRIECIIGYPSEDKNVIAIFYKFPNDFFYVIPWIHLKDIKKQKTLKRKHLRNIFSEKGFYSTFERGNHYCGYPIKMKSHEIEISFEDVDKILCAFVEYRHSLRPIILSS